MRAAKWLTVLVLGLSACSSPPKTAAPPANFPDLSAFCRGRIRGPLGKGCPYVEEPGDSPDTPYQFFMSGPGGCANDRMMSLAAGQKMVGKNGTCAVGDGELIACIDADHKHGFVLQPSDGWSF